MIRFNDTKNQGHLESGKVRGKDAWTEGRGGWEGGGRILRHLGHLETRML